MPNGVIIKGVGSFYYVANENNLITRCRLRGNIRTLDLTPTVGDRVEYIHEDVGDSVITEILARTNLIKRPYISNASLGVIVASAKNPAISYLLIDKMLVQWSMNALKCILVINKSDLCSPLQKEEITDIYRSSGADVIFTSTKTQEGIAELKKKLKNNVSVFSGVSGTGKSSIIKALCGNNSIEVGEISAKNLRGKHTTRHSELMIMDKQTFICDTPGFSSLILYDLAPNDVWKYYAEFYEYSSCRYSSCLHQNEPDCAVKQAVSENKINKVRYENYLYILAQSQKNDKNAY